MDPAHPVGHEAAEEEGGGDRPRVGGGGGVEGVRDPRLQQVAVGLVEGEAPQGVAGRLGVAGEGRRRLVVVGEQGREIGSQGDARRAGQGREVDEEVRLLARRLGERVAEHDAPLRVRVVHLHGQAGPRAEHVARPVGVARHRVLDRRNEHPEPHREGRLHRQPGEPEDVRRAPHVLLHQPHAVRGLEVEAPRVEAHPLAREGHAGGGRVSPTQIDEARRRRARPPDRVDRGVAVREEVAAGDAGALRAVPGGEGARRLAEVPGEEVVGRRVDEVADEGDRLDLAAGPSRRFGVHAQGRRPALRLRGAAPRLLLLPVTVEPVGPEPPADRDAFEVRRIEPGPDPVAAGGERTRKVGAAPRVGPVRDPGDYGFQIAAGARHEAAGVGPRPEAGVPRPAFQGLGAIPEPVFEAVLAHEVDRNLVRLGSAADEAGLHG